MSVISEGDEDDDVNVEMALDASDAHEDASDDPNEVYDQSPLSVPDELEQKQDYLHDLCNYTAYHEFVDTFFETTVSYY